MSKQETAVVADLQAQLAALENENAWLTARLRSNGLLPPPFEAPNQEQLEALIALVERRWPQLRPSVDSERDHRIYVRSAMAWCSFCYRRDALNTKYAATYFLDASRRWLARFDLGSTSLKGLAVAAIASGIRTSPMDEFPYISLAIGDGEGPKHKTAGTTY
jgi:hypothetical protein